jgi:hypothetical protein
VALFTEQMETLTNELRTSRRERDAFVVNVRQRAHTILADAQAFIHAVGERHAAMAERLKEDLAAGEEERTSAAKARRQQNRQRQQTVRAELQESLAQTRVQRQQHVAELRADFRAAHAEVPCDLRQAAGVWQSLLRGSTKSNGRHAAKATETAAAATRDHARNHAADAKEPNKVAAHAGKHPKEKEPHHSGTATHGAHHSKGKKSPQHH